MSDELSKDQQTRAFFAIACWVNDNLTTMNQNNGIGFNGSEIAIMMDRDSWFIKINKADYGGVNYHKAELCSAARPKAKMFVTVTQDIPGNLYFVSEARLEMEGSGVHEYKGFPRIVGVREDQRLENKIFLEAIIDWFKERFNPVVDREIGDEPSDWEIIERYRVSPTDRRIVSRWLRMKNRGDTSYESSFLDPGIVQVTTNSSHCDVKWDSKPRNEYVLEADEAFSTQANKTGIGDWG